MTVVIPVWNDPAGLRGLLAALARLGIATRVIVVDDASDPPLVLGDVLPAAGLARSHVVLLRQSHRGGAGAARNLGLDRVKTAYMLFLDSDDRPTPDLAHLLRDLARFDGPTDTPSARTPTDRPGEGFDFCLFAHADSATDRRNGRWGQPPLDAALWHLAGADRSLLQTVSAEQATVLAETANYPWNKIYRTAFLRTHGIRCSATPVHNDIALHWLSFLANPRILTSARTGVIHYVNADGNRLTNRRGRDRMVVFAPLEQIARACPKTDIAAQQSLFLAFLRFTSGLFDWIRPHLETDQTALFAQHCRRFLLDQVPPDRFAQIARADPVLAMKLVLQIGGGRA